jgi:hypothetical protein
MILTWYENLPPSDMPPRWMWTLTEELNDHFARLKNERGHDTDNEPISGPVLRNELAHGRGANLGV